MGTVFRWHNFFGLCAVEVRTPVRHNAVAAIRGVPAASVANDGIVRDVIRDRQGVHCADKCIFWREGVDAGWEVRFRAESPGATTYFVADTPTEIMLLGSLVRAIPIRPTQLVARPAPR